MSNTRARHGDNQDHHKNSENDSGEHEVAFEFDPYDDTSEYDYLWAESIRDLHQV